MGPSPPLTGCPAARGLLIPREAPEEVGGGPAAAVAAAAGGRQVAVSMAHLSPRKCEVNVDYGAVPHGHCGARYVVIQRLVDLLAVNFFYPK